MLLAGVVSLFDIRAFLRNAAVAKGGISDIYELTPTGARDILFLGYIVTVQFWTEQEESITFQYHTFQGNLETAARSLPVLYDPGCPSEARIHSFEGLWLAPGLVIVSGAGLTLICAGLFVSVL